MIQKKLVLALAFYVTAAGGILIGRPQVVSANVGTCYGSWLQCIDALATPPYCCANPSGSYCDNQLTCGNMYQMVCRGEAQ